MSTSSSEAHRYISRSILFKVRIYLVICLVATIAAAVEGVRGTSWTWLFVIVGILARVALGVVASRMQHLSWNEFEKKAVGKFDTVGIVILVVYILFSVFRSRIVGVLVPAIQVSGTSLGVLAGVMFGQVVGIRRGMLNLRRRVLGGKGNATAAS